MNTGIEYVDIITRIIETEHDARNISSGAEHKHEDFETNIKTEIEKMRENFNGRAERRIKMVSEREHAYALEQIAALEKKLSLELAEIDGRYDKKKDQWVSRLFDQIITGDLEAK